MKHLVAFLILCLCCCSTPSADTAEKSIVVVIPSRNNKSWYHRNLSSVFTQKYHNYRVIFIDDASTDSTGLLVKNYIEQCKQESRVKLIENESRRGALANIYRAIWMCDPQEIVVMLDGDDWFYDDQVLAKLNAIYSDPQVWLTYGQFIFYPCGSPGWAAELPQEVIRENAFREYSWFTTHLRSFYAGLFQKIRLEDLLINGEFFPMAWDLAMMFPMLEMAGVHSRFIPDKLYVYNMVTPMNDIKTDPDYQLRLGWQVRERKKYDPLRACNLCFFGDSCCH